MVDFKSIIREQREELERIEREEVIVHREKFRDAQAALKYPNILAVLGIRRCGKSIFSYLLAKDGKTGYVNFDDERLVELQSDELNTLLLAFYELYGELDYVILDEVQNVKNWELFVNRLRRTKKVIVTGSNSKLLGGELATHLTGRYIDIELFPFSFREYLIKQKFRMDKAYTTKEKAELLNHLRNYLEVGGFPEVYKFGKPMLSRIYEDILTKDILLRYKTKKIEELKKLSNYLITNSAHEVTYSKLSRILDVKNVITISHWISYLEMSFLIFKVEKFDFKLKQQFKSPKKFYCVDTGLLNSIAFQFSSNIGQVIENAVAIELKRRDHQVYYWKDYQQNEVDFVIKKNKIIAELIQVTYASRKKDIREKEIESLFKACRELKCKNLTVITWDYEAEEDKIKFIPFWKWLIETE